jgi:hypothetical protein
MILCTSIAVDDDGGDDILDTLFINGTDDDNNALIFNDLFLLLTLLGFSILAIIIPKTSFFYDNKPICL